MVSDEELLDLLDLALSSDTANTVKRARELMKCRIDPMHLTSQLANIIMDILAGNCLDGAKKKFMGRHTCMCIDASYILIILLNIYQCFHLAVEHLYLDLFGLSNVWPC